MEVSKGALKVSESIRVLVAADVVEWLQVCRNLEAGTRFGSGGSGLGCRRRPGVETENAVGFSALCDKATEDCLFCRLAM